MQRKLLFSTILLISVSLIRCSDIGFAGWLAGVDVKDTKAPNNISNVKVVGSIFTWENPTDANLSKVLILKHTMLHFRCHPRQGKVTLSL